MAASAQPLGLQTESREPKHVSELDGVRGLAILAVIIFHFGRLDPHDSSFLSSLIVVPTQIGWAGVDLFFVLSGCLITGILLDTKTAPNYFATFYMRRALRILPLYYLFVALFFLVLLPLSNRMSASSWTQTPPSEQIWYWLHLSNWRSAFGHLTYSPVGHFWSLAIEEQFYVIWPFVVLFCPSRKLPAVCVSIALFSTTIRNLPFSQHMQAEYSEVLYRLTPFRLEPIALGACIPLLLRNPQWRAAARRAVLPLLNAALVVIIMAGVEGKSLSYAAVPMTRYGFTAIAVAGCALVFHAADRARSSDLSSRIFRSGFLRGLGKLSYGMYVLHILVMADIKKFIVTHVGHGTAAVLLSIAAGLTFSYVFAWLSWHILEKRFLKLKRLFAYERVVQVS